MDYDAYVPDSSRWAKSGLAYRVLGHDAATYYQYAIYVSERHRDPPRFSPAANPRGTISPRPHRPPRWSEARIRCSAGRPVMVAGPSRDAATRDRGLPNAPQGSSECRIGGEWALAVRSRSSDRQRRRATPAAITPPTWLRTRAFPFSPRATVRSPPLTGSDTPIQSPAGCRGSW